MADLERHSVNIIERLSGNITPIPAEEIISRLNVILGEYEVSNISRE